MYAPDAKLSEHYTLDDLTKTSQALSQPNFPTQMFQFDNLVFLAEMLERLRREIGPFNVISGFRTAELQRALASSGEPTGSGTMSFHEVGRAVDIYPTSMSLADYFGRILADESLRLEFAEIAIKPAQNALHLAINVPGDVREPKITGLNQDGVYAKLTLDEIASYIEPFMTSMAEARDYAAAKLVTWNRTPLILGMVAAFGGFLYLALASGKRHRGSLRLKANPWHFQNDEFKIHTWFERDRAHVELRNETSGETVIEWWDEEVQEAVDDGFLNPKDWFGSAMKVAKEHKLITNEVRAPKREK